MSLGNIICHPWTESSLNESPKESTKPWSVSIVVGAQWEDRRLIINSYFIMQHIMCVTLLYLEFIHLLVTFVWDIVTSHMNNTSRYLRIYHHCTIRVNVITCKNNTSWYKDLTWFSQLGLHQRMASYISHL